VGSETRVTLRPATERRSTDNRELRQRVAEQEAELAQMERWRDAATTMTERMERAALVREYSEGVREMRERLDYVDRLRSRAKEKGWTI
jgi:hypothetical protein